MRPINKLLLAAFAAALPFLPCLSFADGKAAVGDTAPDFSLQGQDGDAVTLSEALEDAKGAVLAFYPKDNSPK